MPRGSNTQTRTFNYNTGTTVGTNLLSATNPENGTVTYTYNSDSTLHTKTDAKSQVFTYSYDSYKRLTQIMVGSTVLRTFMYDTNTLDSTFSGSYTQGRLVAVQNTGFTPNGYVGGVGGNGASVPSGVQLIEMYGYTQAGLTSGKRLQVEETFNWYQNNNPESSTQKLNLDATYTYDIEGKATSVNYPSTYSYNPSGQLVTTPGPKYTYSFDSMDRPTGLTDQSNNTDVSNVTYNAANQLLGLNYLGIAETRQYNNLNQMTNLTAGSLINITYTFPAGANDGKISQQTNAISAETVTYQYDSLNRLLSATSSQSWSETYGYDGFGNLQSKTPTGGAPTLSQAVNAATNQIVGVTYDANGNQLSGGYGYDAENRMATATGIQYGYDSRNKRVWSGLTSGSSVTQTVYFYGVDGQRLGIYSFTTPPSEGGSPQLSALSKSLAVYFGGKRVGTVTNGATANFTQDRLGSNGTYYPYGEARGQETQDDVGFATYTQDSATGLDYADQRYYASNFGRFMSPDRHGPRNGRKPLRWNRYTYVLGDPINLRDKSGLDEKKVEDGGDDGGGDDGGGDDGGGGGGGGGDDGGDDGGGDDGGGDPCGAPSADPFDPTPTPDPAPACPAPPAPDPAPPAPNCEDQLNATIYDYLEGKGSPLADYSWDFVFDAYAAGLNPLLLVAIAGAESGFGTSAASQRTDNAFGLLHCKKDKKGKCHYVLNSYDDWDGGIVAVGQTIDNQFVKGNVTVSLLYSGKPGAFCVNQPGFPCSKGEANVENFFSALGGGDPNNSFNLLWPCPE
jgi:RHS repeat-associated protein